MLKRLFEDDQTKLHRLTAEFNCLTGMMNRLGGINGHYIDKLVKMSGDIEVLARRLKAQNIDISTENS